MSILSLFETSEIPDYKTLSSAQSLEKYELTLEELLKKADANFEEILTITTEEATFENIVEKYLDHDEKLGELFSFLHHLDSTFGNEKTRKIIENIQPKIVAHGNKTGLSAELYYLLEQVSKSPSFQDSKTDEQDRSLFLLMRGMRLSGVHLEGKKKKRLEEINHRLSELSTEFSNNTVDSRKAFSYHFSSDESLKEMPEQDIFLAAEEAKKQKKEGWIFTLSPPSYMAIMRYCSSSEIRGKFWHANVQIATSGKHDNRPLVLEMLQLRNKKSALLGHDNYAEYALGDRMAQSPAQVIDVLTQFATQAKEKAKKEFTGLEKFKMDVGIQGEEKINSKKIENAGSGLQPEPHVSETEKDEQCRLVTQNIETCGSICKIDPALKRNGRDRSLQHWDIAYYSEKLKKKSFDLDDKILRQYFPLDQVMDGLFGITKKLFDVSFVETKYETYHDDVIVYEVFSGKEKVAYLIMDIFSRPEKRAGGWFNEIRETKYEQGKRIPPVVTVVGNFAKPAKGKPTLLTHEDVQTIFHEFGHALHGMLGKNVYGNTGNFAVEWDFVELPSQLLENWTWEKQALSLYAKHYETGELLPEELFENLQKSRKFQKGLFLLRQNEFGFLDFLLHSTDLPQTVEELDAKTLAIASEYSILEKPDEYRMYASFGHIFSGGYSAGYYSYLWAEILEADVFEYFREHGILNPKVGEKYRAEILEMGAKKDAAEIFRNFMGRDPNPNALLRKFGFI